MSKLPIYFAPLQGYTEDAYRRAHCKVVGGVERYLTPFVRIIPGDSAQLQKLRTYWDYLEPTIGHKPWKKIHKATNWKKYEEAVGEIG